MTADLTQNDPLMQGQNLGLGLRTSPAFKLHFQALTLGGNASLTISCLRLVLKAFFCEMRRF